MQRNELKFENQHDITRHLPKHAIARQHNQLIAGYDNTRIVNSASMRLNTVDRFELFLCVVTPHYTAVFGIECTHFTIERTSEDQVVC